MTKDEIKQELTKMQVTFDDIKSNPMDLNLLMGHIALMSSMIDRMAIKLYDVNDEH